MPTDLLHLDDADLSDLGIDPMVLIAFRSYLTRASTDPLGMAILASPSAGTRELLMVLARRVGATLRDENIALRDTGGDLRPRRKKLCYLPGWAIPAALHDPIARRSIGTEAACFIQDVDAIWAPVRPAPGVLAPAAVLDLLDERLAARRPTFVSAAPSRLPQGLEHDLRVRLSIIEPT
jgi:hypothetical protein